MLAPHLLVPSPQDQQRVFLPSPGTRKVIFSTNIAETSVTIPGAEANLIPSPPPDGAGYLDGGHALIPTVGFSEI